MPVRELERLPSLPVLYGKAVAGALPGRRVTTDSLPDTGYLYRGATVDAGRLAEFARVCGFRLGDPLPVTYPHLLAFPLALLLMTGPGFPFPAAGVVHLANRISQHRPLSAADQLDLTVHAERLRDHPRGRQVDVVATATVDGVEVWRDVSTYLHRERPRPASAVAGDPAAGPAGADRPAAQGPPEEAAGGRGDDRPSPPPAVAVWRVGPADARAYAAVSGDRNPIHTSTLAARASGFPRRIAHGMWTKSRCLAQLAGRLPDAYTVEVEFRAPLLLPSTVGFSASRHADRADPPGWEFAVHSRGAGRTHLTGTVHTRRG